MPFANRLLRHLGFSLVIACWALALPCCLVGDDSGEGAGCGNEPAGALVTLKNETKTPIYIDHQYGFSPGIGCDTCDGGGGAGGPGCQPLCPECGANACAQPEPAVLEIAPGGEAAHSWDGHYYETQSCTMPHSGAESICMGANASQSGTYAASAQYSLALGPARYWDGRTAEPDEFGIITGAQLLEPKSISKQFDYVRCTRTEVTLAVTE